MYRIVDAYLCEGPKVLLRYGLGLIKLTKRRLKRCRSVPELRGALLRWTGVAAAAAVGGSGAEAVRGMDGFQHVYSFSLLQVRS